MGNRTLSHGATGYKRGCRCDDCRAGKRSEMRAYSKMVRERDGVSPTQKYRPRQSADKACTDCGQALQRLGPNGRCTSCGKAARHKAAARRAAFRAKWKRLERKLAKAAEGAPANLRDPFTAGICAWCAAPFVRRGEPSPFCSKPCNRKSRRRENRCIRGKQWISDADRFAIYERDNWTCQLCGDPIDKTLHCLDNMAASLDHIEPRSWVLIPDDSPRNLRAVHRLCNSLRGDESWLTRPAESA